MPDTDWLNMESDVVLQGAGKDITFLLISEQLCNLVAGLRLSGTEELHSGEFRGGDRGHELAAEYEKLFFKTSKLRWDSRGNSTFTDNQNFIVTQTDFIQGGSLNEQNPYLFSDCSGFVFTGNTSTTIDGSPTFIRARCVDSNNHFTRNTTNQYEAVVIFTHQFVMDFAYRIAILGNTFDVINGPVTNTTRNDGETLLTEGGGGDRTENIERCAPKGYPITDPDNTINVNPFGTGLPENYGLAIVKWHRSRTDAGSDRVCEPYDAGGPSLGRDPGHEQSLRPTFVWGLEKALIAGNTLYREPSGDLAVSDSDAGRWMSAGTRSQTGRDIYSNLRAPRRPRNLIRCTECSVTDNSVSNSKGGIWMSDINVVFVNKDRGNFGTADTGVEIRNNRLTANNPERKVEEGRLR